MDALALEATSTKKPSNGGAAAVAAPVPAQAPVKRKPAKKTKKAVVFFEVEILDAKTKDKLCFLDKVFLTVSILISVKVYFFLTSALTKSISKYMHI